MATQQSTVTIQKPANADLSSDQFKIVKINSSGKVAVAATAGEPVLGVLQNDPAAADRPAEVAISGTTKVLAGGTIDEGDLIKVDANGKAAAASKATVNTSDAGAASDPVVGSYVLGIALGPAAADEIFEMLITHTGVVATTAA